MRIITTILLLMFLIIPKTALALNPVFLNKSSEQGCFMWDKTNNNTLTGLADVVLRVIRQDNGQFLTTSNTWTATATDLPLTELSGETGEYTRNITVDGLYQLRFKCSNTANNGMAYGWLQRACKAPGQC